MHPYNNYRNYHWLYNKETECIEFIRPDDSVYVMEDVDGSDKDIERSAEAWIDEDIINLTPIPPISELVWIPVTERYPDNTRMVLIREGNNISTAHWFKASEDVYEAVNQFHILHGTYISKPTHWMDCKKLLSIPYSDVDELIYESQCRPDKGDE